MQRISKLARLTIILLSAFILVMVFCGCPYSTGFKVDNEPQYQVEEAYLGNWATLTGNENAELRKAVRMNVTKKSDFEYNLIFTGYFGELNRRNIAYNDTIKASAFISDVEGRKFLTANINGENYIAEFRYESNNISILPLAEHFTTKVIKSNDELRRSLMLHFKTRLYPLYDEPFCLRNMIRVN